MDKRTRAYKIYSAGVDGIEDGLQVNVDDLAMLQAIAVMIDFATKKPEKRSASKELLYTEKDLLSVLNYDLTITKYGRLTTVLSNMHQRDNDLEKFKDWFEQSWYPWAKQNDVQLTYSMLCKKYPEWLEKAHQWVSVSNKQANIGAWR